MDSQKIDMFLMSYAKYFPGDKLPMIKSQLEKVDDSKLLMIHSISFNDPIMMLIVSLLGGSLGIDRFILGEVGLGVAKLLTCGGCGIWTIVDWFIVMDNTRENNFNKFLKVISL